MNTEQGRDKPTAGIHSVPKKMLNKANTLQEKRAIKFAILLVELGYGYTIRVPSRQLEKELKAQNYPVSFMTIISYWRTLERMGYVTRTMGARINGVTYYLNRYAFTKLTNPSIMNESRKSKGSV